MTDLEKIAYAKSFIDKLAAGIDPTDGTPIPDGDVAAKTRIVGCFSYVSEVLEKLVFSPETVTDLYRTQGRTVTAEVLARIECTQYSVSVSAFAKRIDTALGSADGYLEKLIDNRDKSFKRPTQKGIELGIVVEQSTTATGRVVSSVRLNLFAQQYIRDHLAEIVAFSQRPPRLADQLPQISFSLTREQLAGFEFSEIPLSISQIASKLSTLNLEAKTGLKASDLADWLQYLGLLHTVNCSGKNYKIPTDAGKQIGISIETRHGIGGDYYISLYSADAQRFIVDHIHGLIRVI